MLVGQQLALPLTLEAELRERISYLEAEVALLKDTLGATAKTVPYAFGLTGQQAQVFGMLLEREIASTETIGAVLFSGRNDRDRYMLVAVQLVHVRRKVKPFGIVIRNRHGVGHYITGEDKQRVRSILEQEKAAGADHSAFLVPADHVSNSSRPTISGQARVRRTVVKQILPFGFTPAEHIVWQELMEMEYVSVGTSKVHSPVNKRYYINGVIQNMRRRLQPFGLEIRNETGRGYFITQAHKDRATKLLEVVVKNTVAA